MNNSPHVGFEKIADLVEGCLTSDEQAQVLVGLSACDHCSHLRSQLARALNLMREDKSEDAPRFAISKAIGLFAPRKAEAPSGLRRWLAALAFDSLQLAPAFGMRAGESAERHLLFVAGENKIHLQVTPSGEEWIVAGQVLGPCPGGEVEAKGLKEPVKAELNRSCEFMLPSLSDGEYALILRLGEVELEIPGLKLGI